MSVAELEQLDGILKKNKKIKHKSTVNYEAQRKTTGICSSILNHEW